MLLRGLIPLLIPFALAYSRPQRDVPDLQPNKGRNGAGAKTALHGSQYY